MKFSLSGLRASMVAVLATSYLGTQCVFAYQPEKGFWTERRKAAQRQSPILLASVPVGHTVFESLAQQFPSTQQVSPTLSPSVAQSVPKEFLKDHAHLLSALSPAYGSIRKVYLPKPGSSPGPLIFHIQDVHMNTDAQRNIGETVRALMDSGQVDLIALEGSTEEINLQPFADTPHRQAVQMTADYLLQKNKISGPIHAALTYPGQLPRILGIDDPVHYEANVQAYRTSAPTLEKTRQEMKGLEWEMESRKKIEYSPALFAYDQKVQAYRAGRVSLGEHVKMLTSANDLGPPNLIAESSLSPSIRRFLDALTMEQTLDFKTVESERTRLLERLTRVLTPEETNALLAQSLAYRSGHLRYSDFYAQLKSICQKGGIPLAEFPSVDAYVRYVLLADKIDAEQLLEDIGTLEKAIYTRLVKTEEEKNLVTRARRLWLKTKLVDFSLIPSEWEEYRTGEKSDRLHSFECFYKEAQARDTAMANNLLRAIKTPTKSVETMALLVAGGYHAEGMADHLTAQGATVISYVPKIEKIDTAQGAAYLSVFTQEKTPLEKLVQGKKLFLAVNPASSSMRTTLLPALFALVLVGLLGNVSGIDVDVVYKAMGGVGMLALTKQVKDSIDARLRVGKEATHLKLTTKSETIQSFSETQSTDLITQQAATWLKVGVLIAGVILCGTDVTGGWLLVASLIPSSRPGGATESSLSSTDKSHSASTNSPVSSGIDERDIKIISKNQIELDGRTYNNSHGIFFKEELLTLPMLKEMSPNDAVDLVLILSGKLERHLGQDIFQNARLVYSTDPAMDLLVTQCHWVETFLLKRSPVSPELATHALRWLNTYAHKGTPFAINLFRSFLKDSPSLVQRESATMLSHYPLRHFVSDRPMVKLKLSDASSLRSIRGMMETMGWVESSLLIGYSGGVGEKTAKKFFPMAQVEHDSKRAPINIPHIGFMDGDDFEPVIDMGENRWEVSRTIFKGVIGPVDTSVVEKMRKEWGVGNRKVLVIGSPGNRDEVERPLNVIRKLPRAERPIVVLALSPDKSLGNMKEILSGFRVSLREREGEDYPNLSDQDVLVVTTSGELLDLYSAGDVAIVGSDRNVMEPASQGKPVFLFNGEEWINNNEAREILFKSGGALVFDEKGLIDIFKNDTERMRIGLRAKAASDAIRTMAKQRANDFSALYAFVETLKNRENALTANWVPIHRSSSLFTSQDHTKEKSLPALFLALGTLLFMGLSPDLAEAAVRTSQIADKGAILGPLAMLFVFVIARFFWWAKLNNTFFFVRHVASESEPPPSGMTPFPAVETHSQRDPVEEEIRNAFERFARSAQIDPTRARFSPLREVSKKQDHFTMAIVVGSSRYLAQATRRTGENGAVLARIIPVLKNNSEISKGKGMAENPNPLSLVEREALNAFNKYVAENRLVFSKAHFHPVRKAGEDRYTVAIQTGEVSYVAEVLGTSENGFSATVSLLPAYRRVNTIGKEVYTEERMAQLTPLESHLRDAFNIYAEKNNLNLRGAIFTPLESTEDNQLSLVVNVAGNRFVVKALRYFVVKNKELRGVTETTIHDPADVSYENSIIQKPNYGTRLKKAISEFNQKGEALQPNNVLYLLTGKWAQAGFFVDAAFLLLAGAGGASFWLILPSFALLHVAMEIRNNPTTSLKKRALSFLSHLVFSMSYGFLDFSNGFFPVGTLIGAAIAVAIHGAYDAFTIGAVDGRKVTLLTRGTVSDQVSVLLGGPAVLTGAFDGRMISQTPDFLKRVSNPNQGYFYRLGLRQGMLRGADKNTLVPVVEIPVALESDLAGLVGLAKSMARLNEVHPDRPQFLTVTPTGDVTESQIANALSVARLPINMVYIKKLSGSVPYNNYEAEFARALSHFGVRAENMFLILVGKPVISDLDTIPSNEKINDPLRQALLKVLLGSMPSIAPQVILDMLEAIALAEKSA